MEKIFFLPVSTEQNAGVFDVSLAGITYPDPSYKIYRRCSDVCVVEYVSSGEGTVICGGNEYHVTEGSVYILPAGKEQRYYSDSRNPWTKKWFNATGTLCEKLPAVYGIENTVYFPGVSVGEIFDEFFDFCAHHTDIREINEKGALIFHRIVQRIAAGTENRARNTAAEIKSYIDVHIYEKLSAASVARRAGYSVSQLGRIFKAEYATTVYSYILDRKIDAAEKLLKSTAYSLKEISDMLNFTDEHYFCNIFRRKRHMTPGEYRGGTVRPRRPENGSPEKNSW